MPEPGGPQKPSIYLDEKQMGDLGDLIFEDRLKIEIEVTVAEKTEDEFGTHVRLQIDKIGKREKLDPVMRVQAMERAFDQAEVALGKAQPRKLIPSAGE